MALDVAPNVAGGNYLPCPRDLARQGRDDVVDDFPRFFEDAKNSLNDRPRLFEETLCCGFSGAIGVVETTGRRALGLGEMRRHGSCSDF